MIVHFIIYIVLSIYKSKLGLLYDANEISLIDLNSLNSFLKYKNMDGKF